MKYMIEYLDGLRLISKEIDGRVPNIGETVLMEIDFLTESFVVKDVITDISYSEPIYTVTLRREK